MPTPPSPAKGSTITAPNLQVPAPVARENMSSRRGPSSNTALHAHSQHTARQHIAPISRYQRWGAPDHNSIAHIAAICMFVASTALTGNAPQSTILNACAVTGVVGALLAGAAGSLSTSGAYLCATRMMLLSYMCAVAGALCMIAGTQSWKATLITALCAITMLVVVVRSAIVRVRSGISDAEAGLPRMPAG